MAPLLRSNAEDQNRRGQAMGGARAWKSGGDDAGRSRSMPAMTRRGLAVTGNGREGEAAGTSAPAI